MLFRRMLTVVNWWLDDVDNDQGLVTKHTEILSCLFSLKVALERKISGENANG